MEEIERENTDYSVLNEEDKTFTIHFHTMDEFVPSSEGKHEYAVIYNETDGAYVLNGTLDANGTAVFNGFKLRSENSTFLSIINTSPCCKAFLLYR